MITPEPIYWPTFSLDAWRLLVSDWPIAQYLLNSVIAVAGSVVIDLALAIPAAYALARYDFKGREDIGFYILSTRMMAPAIVAVPIFFLFKTMGLLDSVWALMLIYAAINLSLVTWIIRSWGGFPDGVAFAVLLMNSLTPISSLAGTARERLEVRPDVVLCLFAASEIANSPHQSVAWTDGQVENSVWLF